MKKSEGLSIFQATTTEGEQICN